MLYSTVLDDPNVYGKVLSIPGIRDRGYVQIGTVINIYIIYENLNNLMIILISLIINLISLNLWYKNLYLILPLFKKKRSVGVLYRNNMTDLTINLEDNDNTTLYIFVENMGRLNFGDDMFDAKVFSFLVCLLSKNNFVNNLIFVREFYQM